METAKKLPPPMSSAWRTIKTGDLGGICDGKTFIELKLIQVRPDKFERFEVLIREISANQLKCEGCISLKYFKRFFTIDGIELADLLVANEVPPTVPGRVI